jgi:hypothetical protein
VTVIVAARMKKGVVIAADSLTTSSYEKVYSDRSKLWGVAPFVFGAAGCVRTNQVIRHHTAWPKFRPDEDTDTESFLVKSVVPAIRTGVNGAGVTVTNGGVESLDSELLIAWGDSLAWVAGNGAVGVPLVGRTAIGSGYAEALGYLGDKGPWTIEQVVEAARRATITAYGCDGRIDYVTTLDHTVVRGEM